MQDLYKKCKFISSKKVTHVRYAALFLKKRVYYHIEGEQWNFRGEYEKILFEKKIVVVRLQTAAKHRFYDSKNLLY